MFYTIKQDMGHFGGGVGEEARTQGWEGHRLKSVLVGLVQTGSDEVPQSLKSQDTNKPLNFHLHKKYHH